jgi:hypothetical protein
VNAVIFYLPLLVVLVLVPVLIVWMLVVICDVVFENVI